MELLTVENLSNKGHFSYLDLILTLKCRVVTTRLLLESEGYQLAVALADTHPNNADNLAGVANIFMFKDHGQVEILKGTLTGQKKGISD